MNTKKGLKVVSCVLALCLLFGTSLPIRAYSENAIHIDSTMQPISQGLTHEHRSMFMKSGWVELDIIRMDLTDPYLELVTLFNDEGLSVRDTVKNLVTDANALVGVNGDFFLMDSPSSPIGAQIEDGELISSPSNRTNMSSFALTEDNLPLLLQFTYSASVTASNGLSYPINAVNKVMGGYTGIYLYTDQWGNKTPVGDNQPELTFAVIQNDQVVQITKGSSIEIPDGAIVLAAGGAGGYFLIHKPVGRFYSKN